ncbi:MAG TPA: tetratricopeptide repeat protein [Pyrinomonadaceae bacterium]|jgi:tetratricopeptide (TPR) repeat protein
MMIRRFALRFAALALLLLLPSLLAPTSRAVAQNRATNDVVIILPFENTSSHQEYNWVGESFADSLSELLSVMPDLIVVSSDERELAYQRVRLPQTTLPSRATAIKLAREARATMIVLGTYSITPPQGETPAALQGSARVIKVNEGRLMGELMPDGRWATREYDFGGALTTLQTIQGRLAYQVLYQRDKALPFSQNQFVQQATKVPPKAFEAYVKGVLTPASDAKRENYFKNALRFYADANAGATYPQPAFELGHFYLRRSDWKNAADYFSKLQKKDPHYAEAAFYAGLAYWRLSDLSAALNVLVPLSSEMPLTGVYNNAGAISIQAARDEKKPDERARLLEQGLKFLARAAESTPEDMMVRFNYAYALFLSGKYAEAAEQLRPVITDNPKDGQAYFLFAKSLERLGSAEPATAADDQARRYLQVYAKWQTEWQKSQTTPGVSLRLRDSFNRSDYFEVTREKKEEPVEASNTQDLLAKARELYQAGRDDEALPELRRVLTIEPMSGEAYLLIGRINQRRGDQEAAISALKTAIFWDAKQIDAHILLGRIFLERGDRAMALTYARSAMQIDSNNQEAIALQRLVDTGGR